MSSVAHGNFQSLLGQPLAELPLHDIPECFNSIILRYVLDIFNMSKPFLFLHVGTALGANMVTFVIPENSYHVIPMVRANVLE